jgi:hypothetical protein
LLLQGCNSAEEGGLDGGAPEFVEHNQKPILNCSITKSTGDTVASPRVVSSDPRLTRLADNLVEGDAARIDCGQCTDDSTAVEDLRFEVSYDYDRDEPVFEQLAGGHTHRLEADEPGRAIMALRVTDREGASTTVPFTLVVQCKEGTKPSIGDDVLDVVSDGRLNYYDFRVNTQGMGSDVRVALDFNGDGVFDAARPDRLSTWTTETAFTKYVEFVGERLVGLKVANNCAMEATAQIPVTFAEDNLPREEGTRAVRTGFPYVQFNLDTSGTRGTGAYLFTTGDVVHSDIKTNSRMKAFAVHAYSGTDSPDNRSTYRFSVNIGGFSDGCSREGQRIHDARASLTVDVAGSMDGLAPKFFVAEDVPAVVTVTCLEASHGCNGGTGGLHAARQLLAEIPSAEMTSETGERAVFSVGLISADRGSRNYSCGSGGGGGGSGAPSQ